MQAVVPTLAVSMIYCIWQAYVRCQLRRESMLRQRVTYMLWVMASRIA